MKEEQLIHKIKSLKKIQPSRNVLKAIQQGVYQQVGAENKPETILGLQRLFENISILKKSYNSAFYGVAAACIVIFFLTLPVFFPNQVHTALLSGRLAFTSNQYQKASIALADTTSKENKPIGQQPQELSQSLALANTQLNELKLKGEKGKYTAQQCHEIYQEYLIYLKKEESDISKQNNPSFSDVKSQINVYEEQAEKKLHMYSFL